jgi:hypothetical protein
MNRTSSCAWPISSRKNRGPYSRSSAPSTSNPRLTSPSRIALSEDVDRIVEGAAAAGATVLRPVKDELYGDRTGMIADPFGHKWQIATPVEDVSPGEMQRRWTATLA